jgi:hypothetical protein
MAPKHAIHTLPEHSTSFQIQEPERDDRERARDSVCGFKFLVYEALSY